MAKNKTDGVILPNEDGSLDAPLNEAAAAGSDNLTIDNKGILNAGILNNESHLEVDAPQPDLTTEPAETIPDRILMEHDFILEIPMRLGVSVTVSLKAGQIVEDKNIIRHVIQSDANYQSE